MKIRIHYFYILLFLIINKATILPGQSTVKIKGSVYTDKGEPLEGANIIVKGTAIGTATNNQGKYILENLYAGEYTIKVSYIGFISKEKNNIIVSKDGISIANFTLTSKIIPFNEIKIEAFKENKLSNNFVNIISADIIQKSNAVSVAELLHNISSVEIIESSQGDGAKKISIRGSSANQVLVLIDGIEINDPLSGEADLNQIPISTIERIKVWKTGNSSNFGSGALGGVIEIITKKQYIDQIKISGQIGSFKQKKIQPAITGNYKNISFILNYEKLKSNDNFNYKYLDLSGNEFSAKRKNADFSSQNFFSKIKYKLKHHSLTFNTNYFFSNRGLPGRIFELTSNARAINTRKILSLIYNYHNVSWDNSLKLTHYYNRTEYKNIHQPNTVATVPDYHNIYRIYTRKLDVRINKVFTYYFSTYLKGSIKRNIFFDKNVLYKSFFNPIQEVDNLTSSGMLGCDLNISYFNFLKIIKLSASMRYDKITFKNNSLQRTDEHLSPHIGLLIAYSSYSLKMSYNKAFREPTFADLFFQDIRISGNAELLPEMSSNIDIGILTNIRSLNIEIDYFERNIKNLIYWQMGSFGYFKPFNTDAFIKGWEFNCSYNLINDIIAFNFAHSIIKALNKNGERTTHNKILTYHPEYSTKLGLIINFRNFYFEYYKRFTGEQFRTPSNTDVKMASYIVDDISVNYIYTLHKICFNIKFSLYNLFDKHYEIIRRAPMPGRNWRTGIEISF